MVSLFSLFGGKKKAKAPSTSGPSSSAASTSSTGPGRRRSRSPVPANPSNNHSSTTPRPVLGTAKSSSSSSGNKLNTLSTSAGNSGTAKFLTIRSRSSAGASALLQKGRSAQRTLTGDSTGGGSGQASAGGSPAWELPSLEFGKGDKDGRLGLDNVGGLPKITKEEWELLQGWKFGMVDINKAWKLLGEGLRISRMSCNLLVDKLTKWVELTTSRSDRRPLHHPYRYPFRALQSRPRAPHPGHLPFYTAQTPVSCLSLPLSRQPSLRNVADTLHRHLQHLHPTRAGFTRQVDHTATR